MFYKDDWLVWKYDGVNFGPKTSPTSHFELQINKTINRTVMSYYDELLENALVIRDTFSGPLDLMLSGGIDGEIVLRCYHDFRIPVNVFIFKYENNYNHHDVAHAINICKSLNQPYTIIDFNLERFFENDAYDIWKKVYSAGSGFLPHMKMTEYLNGMPIICASEPYWILDKPSGKWFYEWEECHHSWAVYHKTINRPVITSWYEYSPEIIVAHKRLRLIERLLTNKIPGKISSNTSKHNIHSFFWPDIAKRPKRTGFEGDRVTAYTSKPDFMLEFDRQFIHNKVSNQNIRISPSTLVDML